MFFFLRLFLILFISFFTFAPSIASGLDHKATTVLQSDDDLVRSKVWKISFEGNDTFSSSVLLNQIAAEAPSFFKRRKFWDRSGYDLSINELRRDVIRIQRFYQRRGFPFVEVSYSLETMRKEWQNHVTFTIEEGDPTIIESVTYRYFGDDDLEESLLEQRDFKRVMNRHQLREERRYERIRHNDVEGNFLSALNDAGYPFPRVIVDATVDSTANTAAVTIEFDPGPIGYFSEFNVTGNESATAEQIIRESALVEGDVFSQRKIRVAQQQIFGHHLYRFVTINLPEQPRDSLVTLNIRVREFPLRSLQTQLGFGFEEIVRTSVSWQHRNPWSTTHSFRSRVKVSFIEQAANLDYTFPYIFNTYSSFTISPFAQRLDERNFELQRVGINNSFLYQYSPDLAGTISYEFTRNNEFIKNPDSDLRINVGELNGEVGQLYDISALQFSGYYGQPFAERGQKWVVRPFMEFSGFFGSGSLVYERFSLDIRRFFELSPSTQLAMKTESGILFADDLMNLPAYLRYYAGGSANVRGWQRRMLGPKRATFNDEGEFQEYLPTGGRSNFTFNLELRQDMPFIMNNFGMAFFLDGGQVWQQLDDYNPADMQYGVGGGFRYNSPLGPIRIDIGYKINPTDEDLNIHNGENFGSWTNRWGLHFSIGQAF